MKDLRYLDKYRLQLSELYGDMGDKHNGAFRIKIKDKWFIVIASNGGGWEHVSVSPEKSKQIPRWEEMCKIKEMFFENDETVIQYIMAKKDNINFKENCLHLWRPTEQTIPTPPKYFV